MLSGNVVYTISISMGASVRVIEIKKIKKYDNIPIDLETIRHKKCIGIILA